MAGETVITIVGNLTADPELRYTQSGLPVVNFTVASTPRTFDRQTNEWKDGQALFLRCSAWRDFAEHIAGSLTKGARVIAQGRLTQRSYDDKDGNKRTVVQLEVDDIGPSLRNATAQVQRIQRQQGGAPHAQQDFPPANGYPPQGQPTAQTQSDGWATPGSYGDETPF